MRDINHLDHILTPSAPRRDSRLPVHGDGFCRCQRLVGRRGNAQSEAEGSPGARPQDRGRHSCSPHCHPVRGPDPGSGVADLGLSRTLGAFRPMVVSDDLTVDQLRQQLVDRVGSLGWVIEGVVQSIASSDVDAATRLWGDEAIDLLWERELLVSPDGNPNHRGVRLSADAQAWASARRAELLLSPTPTRRTSLTLGQLTVRQTLPRQGRRTTGPVLAGAPG
jgi:hypothetical protein